MPSAKSKRSASLPRRSLAGILKRLPQSDWKLYEKVKADQVVAQLDDGLLRAEMSALEKDLDRLQKELNAAKTKFAASEADRAQTYLAESVQLRFELEQRRIAALTQQVQVEVDRLEAERTNTYFECIKPLYDKKMISEQELANARLYRDEAAKRLAENLKVAGEAQSQQKEAEERLKKLPDFLPIDVEKQLAPIAASVEVQRTRIGGMEIQIKQLTIHAPISGMICAINHWPGENVPAGEPIMTIASDNGRYLVSFVRQEQHVEPKEGMAVDVRKRAVVSPALQSIVESVGPQIEPIPQHLCRDPKIPEWGLPVRITLPETFSGRPGELFEITFKKALQDAS
jgi:multidrug resistance efflux pump